MIPCNRIGMGDFGEQVTTTTTPVTAESLVPKTNTLFSKRNLLIGGGIFAVLFLMMKGKGSSLGKRMGANRVSKNAWRY